MQKGAWYLCCLWMLASVGALRAEFSPDKYIIIFQGEPATKTFLHAKEARQSRVATVNAAKARASEIGAQHDAVAVQLKAIGVKEVTRHHKLLNAMTVKADASQVAAIRKLPGVIAVHRVLLHDVNTASSVPFIGAPAVWSGITNADGNGVRIGIIDTGIDYTHADFGGSGNPNDYTSNDPATIEPGTFPTAKVVGGYDFAGNAFNAGDTNHNVPIPDPDPLDCAGHGTHVAGIAAGIGVLTNGTTFTGPYNTLTNFTQFAIGPGVAPRASLYALKVFGCTGSTDDSAELPALEFAADPNNDDDFSDRLDVVNMSLGSPYGITTDGDPTQTAVNNLVDLGCVAVLSAGNSFDTFYNVGSPGTAEKSICVACSIDNGTTTAAIQVKSPSTIAGSYAALEGAFTLPLALSGTKEALLVYANPTDGCSSFANAGAIAGNIALIDRGDCNFLPKLQNAQAAGAIGAIVANNSSGTPVQMTGTSTVNIPAVMISLSDANLLKQHLGEGIIVRMAVDTAVVHPELTDQISDFSSRGPAGFQSKLKPEIAAPGFTISSAKSGFGTWPTDMSGTSMAAPHIAAAAALMRQLHPDWSAEDVKAVLMDTAVATHDASAHQYSESRTGAGRVNLSAAARAVVTATAENSGGLVAMSFGALTLTNVYTETRNIVLTNHSTTDVTYSVSISNTVTENGCALMPLVTNVTVPANATAVVPVQLTADPNLFDRTGDPTMPTTQSGSPRQFLYEFSGQVWFQNTNLSIHLPFYANVRSGAFFTSGKAQIIVPATNQPVTVNISESGISTHPQPLVSAFQLGYISTTNLPPADGMCDLLAVGAASDYSLYPNSIPTPNVYFAAAVATNWATPHPRPAEIGVEIDTNFDGVPDILLNNSTLPFNGNASDVFGTIYHGTVYSYLNCFSATERDTAPFNNSVLVLPIPFNAIGLNPGNGRFNYRFHTGDWFGIGETTPWIKFDALNVAVNPCVTGISAKPFFTDGTSLQITVDPTHAPANALSPSHIGVMLLHHMNDNPGDRLELIDVQFAPQFLPSRLQGTVLTLNWSSAINTTYTLQYATNLNEGFIFTEASGIFASPPVNSYSTTPANFARFYRLIQQ